MTDEEKRDLIEQLNIKINELQEQRNRYRDELEEKSKNARLEKRKQFINRCFSINGMRKKENTHADIKAFKIIELLEPPHENNALCVALRDGTLYDKKEKSIGIEILPLWRWNQLRLMHKKEDLNMIDFYREISLEEFEEMYKVHEQNIRSEIYWNAM